MAKPSAFASHVEELLTSVRGVTVKRMFGGFGVFYDSRMFALIDNDVLYFKTDETNRAEFTARQLPNWQYKASPSNYFRAPEECLDEPDEMALWAKKSIAVTQCMVPKAKTASKIKPGVKKAVAKKAVAKKKRAKR